MTYAPAIGGPQACRDLYDVFMALRKAGSLATLNSVFGASHPDEEMPDSLSQQYRNPSVT